MIGLVSLAFSLRVRRGVRWTNLEYDEILKTWIQLPSATVKGVYVEKNTSYGVRKPRAFMPVIESLHCMPDLFPVSSHQLSWAHVNRAVLG